MAVGLRNVVVIGGSYVGIVSQPADPPGVLAYAMRRFITNTDDAIERSQRTRQRAACNTSRECYCIPNGFKTAKYKSQVLLIDPHSHFNHLFAFVS